MVEIYERDWRVLDDVPGGLGRKRGGGAERGERGREGREGGRGQAETGDEDALSTE